MAKQTAEQIAKWAEDKAVPPAYVLLSMTEHLPLTDKAKKVSPWIIAVTAIITLLGTYFFMTKEDGTKLEMRVEQQEKVVETQAESQRTMTQTMSRIQRTQDAMIVKDPELAPMLREMMEADSTR